jgi:phosphoribosylamine--glycine ligase
MKILIVGGGGREHALAWKISQSSRVKELHAAPGNAGIARFARCQPVQATDITGLVALARDIGADLTVVGPDDPLALGLVDALNAEGLRAFGPTRAAARIESSKTFAKKLMRHAGIPTAAAEVFSCPAAAQSRSEDLDLPLVIKADGLALGKGVIIANSRAEVRDALESMMVRREFGAAGERVVIEEFLTGPEVSVLAFSDGQTVVPMLPAQDHKRALEGDRGPNTGGMGTYAPVPFLTTETTDLIHKEILEPAVRTLAEVGSPFKGVLYAGLMLTEAGPKVLEFNARFGDPETQSLLPLLETDIVDVIEAVIDGRLAELSLRWTDESAACIVLASGGYPGPYDKGKIITGIEDAEAAGALVFQAGTARLGDDLVTSGGRVLGVVGRGATLRAALDQAYGAADIIRFEGMEYRRDIGWRVLDFGS